MANKNWKSFIFFTLLLAVFFILPYIHTWANNLSIKLHFCNHLYCIIFSIILILIALLSWKKKNKDIKKLLILLLIVLIVGIILMNLTLCIKGKIMFKSFSSSDLSKSGCKIGIDCPGDVVEVPTPPCVETDTGRDYISFGEILSGVNLEDICMGNTLRERYCNSETTYTSEDINCPSRYGSRWICEEGECRENETEVIPETPTPETPRATETNCGDGIDNDDDTLIDCADNDCATVCGDFDYSCQHISPYPTCGGTCPQGEECIDYSVDNSGWCECMPTGNTACGESYPNCGGWCGDNNVCLPLEKGCACVFDNGNCYESDGGDDPIIGGYCYDFRTDTLTYDVCASSLVLFEQKCTTIGCDTYSIFCSNDTSYGLFGLNCFDEYSGSLCGSY